MLTTIGVISDTHGYLDPRVFDLFAGVDHILHAGDIGPLSLVRELASIAPVTAVAGNCDGDNGLAETEVVVLRGRTFLLRHVVDVRFAGAELRPLLRKEQPDVIVFGHTHQPAIERWGGMLLFNPGSAGRQRFRLPRTVGILRCDETGVSAVHHAL